jgi:hypothetical protein
MASLGLPGELRGMPAIDSSARSLGENKKRRSFKGAYCISRKSAVA